MAQEFGCLKSNIENAIFGKLQNQTTPHLHKNYPPWKQQLAPGNGWLED